MTLAWFFLCLMILSDPADQSAFPPLVCTFLVEAQYFRASGGIAGGD